MINTLIILLAILIYVTLGFVISVFTKRNDIADVMWGPGIFLSVLSVYFLKGNGPLLTFIIIFTWSLRIFLHIGQRFLSKKEEDFRYENWRKTWKNFYLRSYLQIFLLQGFLIFLVGSSIVFFKINNLQTNGILFLVGSLLAIFALTFETIADQQLKKFLSLKTGGIMKTGLWKYTRHPNYFGEVLFWWAIFISLQPNFNILLLISPLTITYLILYVSGIPMLEKKYIDNVEFQEYKKVTPAFFPKFF